MLYQKEQTQEEPIRLEVVGVTGIIHRYRQVAYGTHDVYGDYNVLIESEPFRVGCSKDYPYVVLMGGVLFGYFDGLEVSEFIKGGPLFMTTKITVVIDDSSLSELQQKLGTRNASTTRSVSAQEAFIESSKAIKTLPGYNTVEVIVPFDGVSLLRGLGYLEKEDES